MSQFSAHSLIPLFAALSTEQKHAFIEQAEKMVGKRDTKPSKKKKSIYDRLDPIFHPDNREALIAEIMNG